MGLEAEGEVDARALALRALERRARASAERAHGLGLVGAAHGHHALSQGPVEVPAQHLRPQRAAGGAAVAFGERPMGGKAGVEEKQRVEERRRRVEEGDGLARTGDEVVGIYAPRNKHTDRVFRSRVCETLDQRCVSFWHL